MSLAHPERAKTAPLQVCTRQVHPPDLWFSSWELLKIAENQ